MIYNADSLDKLKELEADSIDSLVTDPPAGISFMGKEFDSDKGGMEPWVDWLASILEEVYRVLKPGAHGFVWAISRTSHWTGMAIHKAGFEVREKLYHVHSQGFPKNKDFAKDNEESRKEGKRIPLKEFVNTQFEDGWGAALKPSIEEYYLIRKPLGESTIAKNVLKYGTGGINIDENRISHNDKQKTTTRTSQRNKNAYSQGEQSTIASADPAGRWPANLVLSHNSDCVMVGNKKVKGGSGWSKTGSKESDNKSMSGKNYNREPKPDSYEVKDGLETVESWVCSEGCPIAELDKQSGVLKTGNPNNIPIRPISKHVYNLGMKQEREFKYGGDSGTASRFFHNLQLDTPFYYCAKPSTSERNDGLEGMEKKTTTGGGGMGNVEAAGKYGSIKAVAENNHPTLKSTQLMRHLIKLITPKGGTVLDCFMGSGTTGVACEQMGDYKFIGIEKEKDYFEIAKARLKHANEPQGQMRLM